MPHLKRSTPCVFTLVASLAAGTLLAARSSAEASDSTGKTNTIRLVGHVPQRASVSFSPWTSSPLGFLTGRLGLTGLSIAGNNKAFTVSLLAPDADSAGQPRLHDPATGDTVPYRLTYAGQNLTFVDGQAQLASASASESASTPHPLAADLSTPASVDNGRYLGQLVLVVKAR